MKVAGIIAEYNPFHNGHAFHIEETKKQTGADYIVAVISGDFVQRGTPAILDKYERARMALENGVDLVLELPAAAVLAGTDGFARGAVGLLAKTGVVTDLSFGAEIASPEDVKLLSQAAEILAAEPAAFRVRLAAGLRQGRSFPSARMAALTDCLCGRASEAESAAGLLSAPNNILAAEYLKVLSTGSYPLTPCAVPRRGSAYHEQDLTGEFPSAAAIRRLLTAGKADPDTSAADIRHSLAASVPEPVLRQLLSAAEHSSFLREDDFSDLLFFALMERIHRDEPLGLAGKDLSLRIREKSEQFASWTQYVRLLKTKNQTYTALSRCLCQILLGIGPQHRTALVSCGYTPYARILGFRKDAAPLLKELHAKSGVPVITRLSRQRRALPAAAKYLLDTDIRAAELYNRMLYSVSGQQNLSEYRRPLLYL